VTDRFLTTNEASAWLKENYRMDIGPHTIRRLAKAGTLKAHRVHENSWYTFTREALADHAETQGFTRVTRKS
jgi:hypothetical protein